MRFLFIYSDVVYNSAGRFQRGVASLSAALKQRGHNVSLLVVNRIPDDPSELASSVKDAKPDMIGYSSISSQAPYVRKIAGILKPLGIFSVWGGVHPTLDPEGSLLTDGIDAVCLGEGDLALPNFVDTYARGGSVDQVESFYVKLKGNVIVRNRIAPVPEDLDALPFPDYDLWPYEKTDDYLYTKALFVQTSRGCPFNCSYCGNNALRRIYPNAREYMRFRSVESVMRELEYLKKKYPDAREVRFIDDTLSSSTKWFREFCTQYKQRIGLPWSTNDRAEYITEEKADMYRDAGCLTVDMGIESGNDMIRQKVMKRKVKRETIINAFSRLQKRGLHVHAFNILGMPHETFDTILDTIKLNARCKPSIYWNAYFHPFISTDAYTMSIELGLIQQGDHELPTSLAERPVMRLPGVSESEVMFLYKFFPILVGYYKAVFVIAGKDTGWMVTMADWVVKHIPAKKLLNALYHTRADIKRKYPILSKYIVKVKRRILASEAHK